MTLLRKTLDVRRAMNAVQDYLIRKLLIPKVYLEAQWNGIPVEVLAIDRAGSGDVHIVWMAVLGSDIGTQLAVAVSNSRLPISVEDIKSIPSHYRYIALVSDDPGMRKYNPQNEIMENWLADDGVGRVGILYVDMSEDEPSVRVILKAERFRNSKELVELADQFVATHTPNWEVRD